jgi:hypothetical protein
MEEAITSKQTEEKMKEEHEFKSYPLKVAVSKLFEDDYSDSNYLEVSEVNNAVKVWCLWAWRNGKISKEHRRPKISHIKNAMDQAGFNQKTHTDSDGYGNRKSMRVYEDIKKTSLLKDIKKVV